MRRVSPRSVSTKQTTPSSSDSAIFQLYSVFNSIEDVVWILDTNHRILHANKSTRSLTGIDPDEVTGRHCWEITHKTDGPIPECPILRMSASRKREKMSMQVGDRWLQVTVDPLINAEGVLEGAVHIIRDITDIHRRDEILLEHSHRFNDLIELAPFGAHIYHLQEDDRLVFTGANPAANKILGVDHDQFVGKTIEEAFPPLAGTEIPESYKRVARTGEHYSTEQVSYSDEKGIKGAFEVRAFQIGEKRMVAFFQDITERKKQEMELKEAKEKAEESDRLKSAFLANLSHEIRTPMNGIIGLASMLEEPGLLEEEKTRFLRIIRNNSFQLLQIISDIVDISKIEAGQIDLKMNDTCLNALFENLEEFYHPMTLDRDIRLTFFEPVQESECCIRTDDVKLRQVLDNLIGNAMKFTAKGEISVSYTLGGEFVEFTVSDTGIGISPEHRELIFDRFMQVERSISRQFGGTGLGLSISRAFVEKMGGRIWFDSTPGIGTIFHFTVPNIPVGYDIRKRKEKVIYPQVPPGITVLVVEDEMANFEYLDIVLRKMSVQTLHALTGSQALELLSAHPEVRLILMDVKLPDKSGYDVTREIMASGRDIRVIAQTAYALADERTKALEAGCVDYLPKPIRKEALITLIGKYLS